MDILKLRNPIREYAWGSRHELSRWMGRPAATRPEAELWMGAHHRAPSQVLFGGRWVELGELIAEHPEGVLGSRAVARWGAALPYLFKVLAVERALSLQTHPDRTQAEAGWARENALGIPLEAAHRTYADPSHKPELICALSAFVALKGFRPTEEIRRLLAQAGAGDLLAGLPVDEGRFLSSLLDRLLTTEAEQALELVSRVREAAQELRSEPAFDWTIRLADAHPADPAALAPLLLNLVELESGEALFLPPGELHCYLAGMAVEVMANSDNVLRGGLTTKYIDRQELQRVLRFESGPAQILRAEPTSGGFASYATLVEEFRLSRADLAGGSEGGPIEPEGAEILLCARGVARVCSAGGEEELRQGESLLVPYSARRYALHGEGLIYRVSIPV